MKRRIDWRTFILASHDGSEPDAAIEAFTDAIFERLIPHNIAWIKRHGEPADHSHRVFIIGAAIASLFAAANGDISLVTDELVADVYSRIEPDPDLYLAPDR